MYSTNLFSEIMLALGLIYLDQIDSGLPSRFFWVLDGVFLVLGTLSFSLARILAIWEEEDDESE